MSQTSFGLNIAAVHSSSCCSFGVHVSQGLQWIASATLPTVQIRHCLRQGSHNVVCMTEDRQFCKIR